MQKNIFLLGVLLCKISLCSVLKTEISFSKNAIAYEVLFFHGAIDTFLYYNRGQIQLCNKVFWDVHLVGDSLSVLEYKRQFNKTNRIVQL